MRETKLEQAMLPVMILTGFLGAGKTTMLRALLSDPEAPRTGVLVNDFGEINIDADLVAETESDGLIALQNGCVCCSIRDDLIDALAGLLKRQPRPERLIIEASGLSRPLQIAAALEDAEIADRLTLDGIICLVDCGSFLDLDFAARELAMDQIFGSDLALLNKTDLASEEELTRIEKVLTSAQPRLKLLRTIEARVPTALLAGLGDGGPRTADGLPDDHVCGPECLADHGHAGHAHRHDDDETFASWSTETEACFDPVRLRRALTGLPAGILRAKGILRGPDGDRITVDLVGKRIRIIHTPTLAPETSRLVVLGTRAAVVDADLQAAFFDCTC